MASVRPLVKLQQIDLEIMEASQKLANLDPGESLELEQENTRKALADKQSLHHDLLKALKNLELQLASIEEHKKKFENKLFSGASSNPKELSSWEKEIEGLKHQQNELEDKILLKMDEIEKQEIEITQLKAAVAEAQIKVQNHKTAYEKDQKDLKDTLISLKEKREKNLQTCEPLILGKYEEIKTKRNGIAVVKVIRGNCGGCFINLPQGLLRKVQERQIEFCSSCGRILYVDSE
jgi:uncharacterized protein